MAYLQPDFSQQDILGLSNLALAHLGDGVYDLMVRTYYIGSGATTGGRLHELTCGAVRAGAQARAAVRLLPLLSAEEAAVYKRGRNAELKTVPSSCSREEYAKATGLETLFGYLYLTGRTPRLEELFAAIADDL